MTDKRDPSSSTERPEGIDELEALPLEIAPPASLERRVEHALVERGLLIRDAGRGRSSRAWLAAVAAIVLVGFGFLVGRLSFWNGQGPAGTSGPNASYALVLYETERFESAGDDETGARYDEYSRWVARARERGQFVTGEDFSVREGVTLANGAQGVLEAPGISAPEGATLSGMFIVTGRSTEEVVELARSLPHLRYGGDVVVQRVVPTDVRPD